MKKILLSILAVILAGCGGSTAGLTPISKITHGHGLAVDHSDSSKLYIATHNGLLLLKDDKELFRVGKSTDDYMGFTPHPKVSNVFLSSGHPSSGGNLGFQKSENGGLNWKKVSRGANGPVDFHTMTISSVDPNLIYGLYQNIVQKSVDGGVTWEIIGSAAPAPIVQLLAHPTEKGTIFAATIGGLFVSNDQGVSWDSAGEAGIPILAVAVDPIDPNNLFVSTAKNGLMKSTDGGKTWIQIDEKFDSERIFLIAIDPNDPQIMYLLTESNALYKSSDSGAIWSKVR